MTQGIGRMLVVLDRSGAAEAAVGFVEGAAGGFGTVTEFVEVAEQTARHRGERVAHSIRDGRHATYYLAQGPSQGARNRLLAGRIADSARHSGADVIVLGLDRRRLARHRFGASLRSRLAAATDLPVLVAPAVRR